MSAAFAAFMITMTLRTPAAFEPIERVAADPSLAHINAVIADQAQAFTPSQVDAIAQSIGRSTTIHGVDPDLVLGIIAIESRFDGNGQSPMGALGLMQVKPSTARAFASIAGVEWQGRKTLLDPDANIRIGVAYLAHLLRTFSGDVMLALAAYCYGPTRVTEILRAGGKIPRELRTYGSKVARIMRAYRWIARASQAA